MFISNNNFSSIEQMATKLDRSNENRSQRIDNSQSSFYEILTRQQESETNDTIRFSKHANERLQSRNIDLTNSQMQRLTNGTAMAKAKGVSESLVCVDNYAFIVNTKSNTVITALGDEDEKVFTNIDGAVII